MSRAPRIPAAEWNAHKEQIHFLYIDQDKKLDDLVRLMREDYGFHPTRAQYIRKLDSWRMKKNLTEKEWASASALVRKRKSTTGKETELVIGGRVIAGKKLKKEMGRYDYLQYFGQAPSAEPETTLDRIVARTPPSAACPFILCSNLPWFQFQNHTTELASMRPPILNETRIPPFGQLISSDAVSCIDFAKKIFTNPVSQYKYTDIGNLDDLSKMLEDVIPKTEHSDSDFHVQKLSQPQPSVQVIQWAVYLSSNGLLPNEKTDGLLRWVIESGNMSAMDQILGANGPTVRTFASNILLSAIRIGHVKTVQKLLAQGVSANSADSTFPEGTALQTAVAKNNVEISQLLLDQGADVDYILYEGEARPLELAARRPEVSVALVQILIKAGPNASCLQSSVVEATICGNLEVVKLLIAAGADFKELPPFRGSALQHAASTNNIDLARTLIAATADVNIPLGDHYTAALKEFRAGLPHKYQRYCTPIQLATLNGNKEMVQLLLGAGAYPNKVLDATSLPEELLVELDMNEADFTDFVLPLQQAVLQNDPEMVELLLNGGASPTAVDLTDSTALQYILAKDHFDRAKSLTIAQLLLSKGADVNAPPGWAWHGMTALQAASRNGDMDLVNFFLERGANPNAPCGKRGGRTALQAAAESGSLDLFLLLIEHGAIISTRTAESRGLTYLQAAALSGNLGLVNLLLQLGAEVNAPASAKYGRTALQAAVEIGNQEIVEGLLDAGANVNQIGGSDPIGDRSGIIDRRTALLTAIEMADCDLFDLLMENGADPDPQPVAITPLALAVELGLTPIVNSLLDAGANSNRFSNYFDDYDGTWELHTPLNIALYHGFLKEVRMLLDAKADPNLDNPGDGTTPLYNSLWFTRLDDGMTEMLILYGADVNAPSADWGYPVQWAIAGTTDDSEANAAVQMLMDNGADVNAPAPVTIYPDQNMTALQPAVYNYCHGLVKTLLGAGADVNAPASPKRGRTALQAAAEKRDLHLARELIEHGAKVNAPAARDKGATALQFAAITGHINMAVLLLENGADVNAEPAAVEGRTALNGAAEHGRLDMVHLLLGNDQQLDSLEDRCQEAAEFADRNSHFVLAEVLRGWKRP
ncbi:hypothetical protein QQZ08_006127 [Neonectria magnoliae]|uniref:Clr5 domain-containing protein n=1 Tax=Neonectria magnoliae TaxID=2732573 RepID=A0ABR1I1G4_9HYPO